MSDESLEIRPEDMMTGRAMPPEMIHDLLAIAQIDARTVNLLHERLSTLKGFSVEEAVTEVLQSSLPNADMELADCIVRTLMNLKPSVLEQTLSRLDRWRQSAAERQQFFDDESFANLERNLQILVVDHPSIKLIRKANWLLRAVGNEFDSVAIFCDMRPVFDDRRERVEGFITLANMRLMYVSQDGERHAFELALSQSELQEFIEEGKKALAKFEVLNAASEQIRQAVKD